MTLRRTRRRRIAFLLGTWTAASLLAADSGARSGSDPPSGASSAPPGGIVAEGFPLRFDSEVIRLRITGDSLEVDGSYFLVCRRPIDRPLSLIYPFPRDSLLTGARMVSGQLRIGGAPWSSLRFDLLPDPSRVRWWVPPCPGDTIEIRSLYRQGLKTRYARYIVTTTRAWEEPLRHARFEIRLPAGTKPVEFSFPFEARTDSAGTVHVWEADSFYPDRDITVRWE
jgi:hypothetical protein